MRANEIAENLDEARGFGLHLTLAHQFPSQLIEASREYGQRLYDSIMENARSKVVFSMASRERNLSPLADHVSNESACDRTVLSI